MYMQICSLFALLPPALTEGGKGVHPRGEEAGGGSTYKDFKQFRS